MELPVSYHRRFCINITCAKRAHIQSVKWETTGGRSHQLEGSTREPWSNYKQLMKQQSENTSCLTIVGALITILLGRVNYSWSALPRTLPQEWVRDFVRKQNAAGRSASSLSSFQGQAKRTKFACAVCSFVHTQSNTECIQYCPWAVNRISSKIKCVISV